MLNSSKIATKLNGLVGFRQPFNPLYQKLDADNLASRSGLYVTDNEFCKIEYLYDSQDFVDISDEDFNLWLANKQNESIISVCNSVFNEASFRERNLVYKHAINKTDIVTLPNGFVGYRIKPTTENNVAISIKRVICDFSGTGDIELVLFSSERKTALFTKTVTISSDNHSFDLDWTIDNTLVSGGEYFLGYINDTLTVTPYARNYNSSNILSCFRDFEITAVTANDLTGEMFDLRIVEGLSEATGLNLDITTYDDYTDLVMNNEQLFSRAILLDLQISCLHTYMASLRSNSNERNGERMALRILAEVEGQSSENAIKITGLKPQLFRAIGQIKKEIESLQDGYFGKCLMVDTLC